MLREFIRKSLEQGTYITEGGNKTTGSINARIKSAVASWTGQKSLPTPTSLNSLIEYEVNNFLAYNPDAKKIVSKSKTTTIPATIEDKQKIQITTTSTYSQERRDNGTLVVTQAQPPKGMLEDGAVISFNSRYVVNVGERLRYTYSKVSGNYTVYTYDKGKVKTLFSKPLGGLKLSEQFGDEFYTQMPQLTNISVIKERAKADAFLASDAPAIRLGIATVGVIKDGFYTEYTTKTVSGVRGIETTKEIDLAAYITPSTGEYISVGKYLLLNNCVFALILRHTRCTTRYADEDINLGLLYNFRQGEMSVVGELLIINRSTDAVVKKSYTRVTGTNQLVYSGLIDMLLDVKTNKLVFAELDNYTTRNLAYETAKLFVKHEDRVPHGSQSEDITKTTVTSFYTWISQEAYYRGYPDFVHVKKDGSATWGLKYPTLTVSTYDFNQDAMTINVGQVLYTDNSDISSKYGYDCTGGFINCILYQDIFDEAKPFYIGRGYDAWTQVPYTSDDYTITPGPFPGYIDFFIDTTNYIRSALPGELVGFFGFEYFKILDDGTAQSVIDIPGDYGKVRSCLKDDIPGVSALSNQATSTHMSLLTLNNYVTSEQVSKVRDNSVFNTFSGGPGMVSLAYSTPHPGVGFSYIWAAGLHIYTTRFAIIRDKGDLNKSWVIVAGSREQCVTSLSDGRPYRGHHMTTLSTDSNSGFYIARPAVSTIPYCKLSNATVPWPCIEYTHAAIGNTYNPDPAFWISQVTYYSFRFDLVLTDAATFYAIASGLQRQFDTYYYPATYETKSDGWLWWHNERHHWRLENDVVGVGWYTDSMNTRGEETRGVETPKLQYY